MRRAILVGVALCLATLPASAVLAAGAGAQPATPQPKAAPAKVAKAKPTKAKPADWNGAWTGALAQVGRAKPFAYELTLKGRTGTSKYPDDHCAGKLERVGTSGNYAFFTETITEGKLDPATKHGCLDGSLTLMKDASGVTMSWMTERDGKAIVAYGTLMPAK